jgi:hypothetical protein
LPREERIKLAKTRADRLVDHLAALLLMHEANAIVLYSPALASQIPQSFAAHAFNQFQRSMHLFEILRTCALWDAPSEDRESIPTILKLVSEPEIIDSLVEDAYRYFSEQLEPRDLTPSDDPEIEAAKAAWWSEYKVRNAEERAKKTRDWLAEAAERAEKVQGSPELRALIDFRHSYIAHNLDLPEPALDRPAVVLPVRYGDERKVLEATVPIADALHLAIKREFVRLGRL